MSAHSRYTPMNLLSSIPLIVSTALVIFSPLQEGGTTHVAQMIIRLVILAWAGSAVVGELELRGGRIQAELHRATLGMGLRRSFTGKGYGGQLMERALGWARDEARLSWIDLGVFSDNLPAQKLYRRWGFRELGVRPDAFRIEGGVVVDDILMVLDLRAK